MGEVICEVYFKFTQCTKNIFFLPAFCACDNTDISYPAYMYSTLTKVAGHANRNIQTTFSRLIYY